MATEGRRLTERVLDPSYLSDLRLRTIEQLRALRAEAKDAETELSFERRLCQGRIDILQAELERREGAVTEDGVDGGLIARLPEILASRGAARPVEEETPLPARAPTVAIPRSADAPRRRVEEIVAEQTLARLESLASEEIEQIVASLAGHEHNLSQKRRAAQDVLDRLQAEIVRRYTSGEADPSAHLV